MNKLFITMCLEFHPDNEIVVTVVEYPEVVSCGATIEEAVTMGADAICEALAGRRNNGEPLVGE